MAKDNNRARRVGEQIQRELAMLIPQEVKDPRLGMITVTAVDVSRDLAYARVFILVMGEQTDAQQSIAILNKTAGFLRHTLSKRMQLRSVPQLQFIYDESVDRGTSLSALIEQAVSADRDKPDSGSD